MTRLSLVLSVLLMISSFSFGPTDTANAQTSTCKSSVGPGLPPPSSVPSGIPGFHAAWYGQSGYPTLCPGEKATSVVAYYNSGSLGWVQGVMGQAAYLGTWDWIPGQDKPSELGGDGTNGTPNTGWPRYNRIAQQPAPYVGPGQVAWFTFTIQAPVKPGFYRLYLRPLIEGATWMEDIGVYWLVTVLNSDGTLPPPQPAAGCREWPNKLGTQLYRLPIRPGLCLLPYTPVPAECAASGGCYLHYPPKYQVWVRQQASVDAEAFVTSHEVCHSHQSVVADGNFFVTWVSTTEGQEFQRAWQTYWAQYPHEFRDQGSIFENFADVCAGWYSPYEKLRTANFPPLYEFAQKWLPR